MLHSKALNGGYVVSALLFVLGLWGGCISVTEVEFANEYYNLANTYYDQGEFERATQLYAKALAINPEFYSAEYNLAFAYMRLAQYENAHQHLQRLATADPDNLLVQESIGYLAFLRGNEEEALEIYSDILERDAARIRVLNNLALIREARGEAQEALALFQRAYEIDPNDTQLLYSYLQSLRVVNENLDSTSDASGDVSVSRVTSLERDTTNDSQLTLSVPTTADDLTSDARATYLTPTVIDNRIIELARALSAAESISAAWQMEVALIFEEAEYFNDALTLYERIKEESDFYNQALFRQSVILLTAAGEPQLGLNLLRNALDRGFKESQSLLELYDHELLLQKEEVEALYAVFQISIAQLRGGAEIEDAQETTDQSSSVTADEE